MKKLIAAAAAVFCMAVSAHAQIGITAGLTSTSSTLKDAKQSFESGNVNQYHVGLVYKIGLGNILAIQPGLVYNVKGSSFDISNIGNTSVDFKTGFLEIPVQVQAGLGIGKIARVYALAEPFVGVAVSNKVTVNSAIEAVSGTQKTWDNVKNRMEYGIGLGAGVELFRHVQASVKYFWNFGNLYGQNTENPDLDSVVNDILNVDKNNVGGIAATVTVLF